MPQFKKQRILEKRLSYRIPLEEGQEEARIRQTAQHWADFTWEAGRHIVEWNSPVHGNIQVWAIDEAEGIGVIEWALLDMGVDIKEGDIVTYVSKSPRNGRTGTVVAIRASCRVGASGMPFVMTMPPSSSILGEPREPI